MRSEILISLRPSRNSFAGYGLCSTMILLPRKHTKLSGRFSKQSRQNCKPKLTSCLLWMKNLSHSLRPIMFSTIRSATSTTSPGHMITLALLQQTPVEHSTANPSILSSRSMIHSPYQAAPTPYYPDEWNPMPMPLGHPFFTDFDQSAPLAGMQDPWTDPSASTTFDANSPSIDMSWDYAGGGIDPNADPNVDTDVENASQQQQYFH
jgi:hypothetical protein